jgi:hypothetical protein
MLASEARGNDIRRPKKDGGERRRDEQEQTAVRDRGQGKIWSMSSVSRHKARGSKLADPGEGRAE